MPFKNQDEYEIPSFAVSSISDGKISMIFRLKNIFEDDKKKNGIIILVVVFIIAIIASLFFVFGNKKVEQTNESLTIYTLGKRIYTDGYADFNNYDIEDVVREYENDYPDVQINVVPIREDSDEVNFEELYDKISTELIAGKGPDVLVIDSNMIYYKDIDKLTRSGVFAEMDEFIAADTETEFENHIPSIMACGNYKGRRYLMPLRFTFPLLMSGEKALENAGIDIDNCNDYVGLMKELNKFTVDNPKNSNANLFSSNKQITYLLSDMSITAYDNRILDNPEQVKQILDLYKPIYNMPPVKVDTEYIPNSKKIKNGELVFACYENFIVDSALASLDGLPVLQNYDTPVFIPLKSPKGGISAQITTYAGINANSPNQQNAYNFIKILMSANGNMYMRGSDFPVNKNQSKALIMNANPPFDMYKDKWDVFMSMNQKEHLQPVADMIDEIDSAYHSPPFNRDIDKLLNDYLADIISYDACFNKINESVSLYQSE